MTFVLTPSVFFQAASALISISVAVVAWRRPGGLRRTLFAFMMTAVSVWTLAAAVEAGLVGVPAKTLLSKISYLGAVNVAPLFLLFAWNFRHDNRRIRARAGLLWIVPAAVLGLTATNELHGLIWSSVTLLQPFSSNVAVYGHGPAWWILSGYDFALLMVATIYLTSSVVGVSEALSRRSLTITLAVAVVWTGFVLYIIPGNPVPGLDVPAFSFALAGVLVLVGLARERVPALSPIARDMLVEAMPDGLIVEDSHGRVIDANPSALSLLRKSGRILGSPLQRAFDDWPELALAVSRIGPGSVEIVRRDARVFELTAAALTGPLGDRIGRMISLRDITTSRRGEEASKESERTLRTLLAAAQRQAKELELLDQIRTSLARELDLAVIFRTVIDGLVRAFAYTHVSLYVLEAEGLLVLKEQFGYSTVIQKIPVTQGIAGRAVRSRRPLLVRDVRSDPDFLRAVDGIVSEVCVPLFDNGKPIGVLNVESTMNAAMTEADLRLMTAVGEYVSIAFSKARLYADARANEKRYGDLVAALGEGIVIVDLHLNYLFANPAAETILGVPAGGLVGKNLSDFVSETDLRRLEAEAGKRRRGESSTYEHDIRRPDGEVRHVEVFATPHRNGDAQIDGTLAIFHDITELRRLQENLEQERHLLLTLIDSVPDYVYLKDRDSRFMLTNKAQALLVGAHDPRELVGKTDYDFVRKELADQYRSMDRRVMESGTPVVNIDEASETADGTLKRVLTTKVPIYDAAGNVTGLVGISRDITDVRRAAEEREKLQEQLQHAQKMEAVGRLAGGIAHDFNNLLTVMNGYCALGLEETRADGLPHSYFEQIGQAVRRATALVAQLLAFSRKQILQPRVLDLSSLLQGMEEMLKRLLGEDIDIQAELAAGLWSVLADPGKIEQAVMNLAVNARDAMPRGGILRFVTSNVPAEDAGIRRYPEMKAGDYVLLSISDTGLGMDDSTVKNVFEPFFTTKEKGRGTGLGLSTVYGIVKQSEGYIFCSSVPGTGTTFEIYLPRCSRSLEESHATTAVPATPRGGTETILLVEDDEAVRSLVVSVLEKWGYNVFAARSGPEALQSLESSQTALSLLITDVVMPNLNGKEVAEQVVARFPRARVLFMSGHTEDAIVHQGVLEDGVNFIQKPFGAADLLAKVREILDKKEDGMRAKPH